MTLNQRSFNDCAQEMRNGKKLPYAQLDKITTSLRLFAIYQQYIHTLQ